MPGPGCSSGSRKHTCGLPWQQRDPTTQTEEPKLTLDAEEGSEKDPSLPVSRLGILRQGRVGAIIALTIVTVTIFSSQIAD